MSIVIQVHLRMIPPMAPAGLGVRGWGVSPRSLEVGGAKANDRLQDAWRASLHHAMSFAKSGWQGFSLTRISCADFLVRMTVFDSVP